LQRTARRALAGLARTGSDFAGGSGDYALAFEEAILNSLFMARTTTGTQGHTRYAVPHDWVRRACAAAGVLTPPGG
jgi:D-aminopeptidase